MHVENLNTVPKTFSRQADAYEKAGIPADFTIDLPFAANYESLFNVEALQAIGIEPVGLARQLDQVYLENIGNNLASRIKTAAKKSQPLPTQADLDELIAAYDFSGARTTSSEGLSSDERTLFSEIKKYCRKAFVTDKVFNQNGFYVTRIQTGKEAGEVAAKLEAGEDVSLPKGTLALDEFNAFVQAAFDGTVVEVSDAEGMSHTIDFGSEVMQQWLSQPREDAARIIERNKAGAVAPLPFEV